MADGFVSVSAVKFNDLAKKSIRIWNRLVGERIFHYKMGEGTVQRITSEPEPRMIVFFMQPTNGKQRVEFSLSDFIVDFTRIEFIPETWNSIVQLASKKPSAEIHANDPVSSKKPSAPVEYSENPVPVEKLIKWMRKHGHSTILLVSCKVQDYLFGSGIVETILYRPLTLKIRFDRENTTLRDFPEQQFHGLDIYPPKALASGFLEANPLKKKRNQQNPQKESQKKPSQTASQRKMSDSAINEMVTHAIQTSFEENLARINQDAYAVAGYVECPLCHCQVLTKNLDSHRENRCPARPDYVPREKKTKGKKVNPKTVVYIKNTTQKKIHWRKPGGGVIQQTSVKTLSVGRHRGAVIKRKSY